MLLILMLHSLLTGISLIFLPTFSVAASKQRKHSEQQSENYV